MKRRAISLLLACSLLLLPLPAFGAGTSGADVQRRIDEYYKAVQTVETPCWNAGQGEETLRRYAEQEEYAKSVTDRVCFHGGGACRSNTFGGYVQCFGFAKYMCYLLYNSYPKYAQSATFSGPGGKRDDGWTYYDRSCSAYPGLKPGDMVRWYLDWDDMHAAVVYSVSGGSVTLFDCNNYTVGMIGCRIAKSPVAESIVRQYYNNRQAYICRYTGKETALTLSFSTGTDDQVSPQTKTDLLWKKSFTVPKVSLSREGCTFAGWSQSPDGEARWQAGDKVGLRKSATLYAVWKVNDPATGSFFADVTAGRWYEEAVRYVSENGLMAGCGEGRFCPNSVLTRAQLVQILYNREGCPDVSESGGFSDVKEDAWYLNAVNWACTNGVVTGYASGLFKPDRPVAREELAVILHRYAGSPESSDPETLSEFGDAAKISEYAVPALSWAVEQGILHGKGGGTLDPLGAATRAEAASMLQRFFTDRAF